MMASKLSRATIVGALALATAGVAACSAEVAEFGAGGGGSAGGTGGAGGAGTGGAGTGGVVGPSTSDKIDLLFVIDNSRSMADKQRVLSDSLPTLVTGLVEAGVGDMHVGVVSSSLGGRGADSCSGAVDPSENDHGHLVARDGDGGEAPTFMDLGFLAWNPDDAEVTPPGEYDGTAFGAAAQSLIEGVGEVGCGYESPLESFYRFLIDPDPYESISLVNGSAELVGTDQVILKQRADFMRPDSLLVVIVLTDENDCSGREGGQFHLMRQLFQPGTNSPFHLPPARAACAADPADPCCRSCGEPPGPGCSTEADQCDGPLSALDDNIALRCFDQKRRFGVDFLHPIDRYVNGLSSSLVSDRHGNVTDNPIYAAGARGSELVTLTAIVGAPWQLTSLAGDPTQRAARGSEIDAGGWSALIGDPDAFIPPTDPHMVESVLPRAGLPGPGSAANADPIHGHDHTITQADDLQYACTFPLATPRDCAGGLVNCDCNDPDNDKAICDGSVQIGAKSYPGIRPLELVRDLGHRGVAGSICPAQQADPTAPAYGYTPIFRTIHEIVAERLE